VKGFEKVGTASKYFKKLKTKPKFHGNRASKKLGKLIFHDFDFRF